jgi:hypothetical protein
MKSYSKELLKVLQILWALLLIDTIGTNIWKETKTNPKTNSKPMTKSGWYPKFIIYRHSLTKTTKPSKYCISGSRLTAHVSRLTAQGIMNHNITNTAATTDAKVVLYCNLIRPNKREEQGKENCCWLKQRKNSVFSGAIHCWLWNIKSIISLCLYCTHPSFNLQYTYFSSLLIFSVLIWLEIDPPHAGECVRSKRYAVLLLGTSLISMALSWLSSWKITFGVRQLPHKQVQYTYARNIYRLMEDIACETW